MAIKLTPESFLNVVRQSNLVTGDVLKRVLTELREEGVAIDSSGTIADQLVERNLLTRWQADKLLQGKHKGFFLGKYRLLKLLGKGGMSSVYLAEHVLMRRQCAIKVLPTKRVNDTSYLGRFHREAQAVASLDHPNIIKAYDVDKEMEKDTEIHFLVMEFVDGRSLQEVIQQDGPVDYQTAAEYIRQSAEGLAHAHGAGMVHRDIKPGNLLIDRNETVKLLDMGLARFFHDSEEESLTVAHDEKVLGTADYLAPEQALDSHSVDARADLYSLGCTFYFLLTGHPPFTEGTLAQRLMSHQTKQPPPVTQERPDMPPDLLAILNKMMAKKREDRYQTAAEISRDLGAWLVEHASETWQQSHPGLSGKNYSTSKKKSSVIAKSKVPVANPATRDDTPRDSDAEEAESNAGNELSAFLANLGSGDSSLFEAAHGDSDGSGASVRDDSDVGSSIKKRGSGRPDSGKIAPEKHPPKESAVGNRVQTAKPVTAAPVGKPPAAQQVPGTTPKAVAAEQSSSSDDETSSSTALVEDSDFPNLENEFSIDTSKHLPDVTMATPSSKKIETEFPAPPPEKRLWPNRSVLIGLAGVLALLVGIGIYWSIAGNGQDDSVTDGGAPRPDGANLIGKPILVGTKGSFQTLKEALDYVAEYYDDLNSLEPQVIELAAGEVFPESINLDKAANPEFPNNVHIMSDSENPATLKPDGTDPVIHLAFGVNGVLIENLKVEADGKKTAIHLAGKLENSRLVGLELSGYESIGIQGESVFGSPMYLEEERSFQIQDCTFHGTGEESTGIVLENTGSLTKGNPLEEIVLRGCRFLGPMKAGLEIRNAAYSLQVLSNAFVGEGSGAGIEWTGAIALNRVLIANNTFYNLAHGITFASMPNHVMDSGIHRNLFVDMKQQEASLLEGDPAAFYSQFLRGPALDFNVTTGGKTNADDLQEINLFAGRNNKTDAKVSFVSTDESSGKYLAPKDADSLPKPSADPIRIGTFSAELKPYVGAVAP